MMADRSRSATDWSLPKDKALSIDSKYLEEGALLFRCHSRLLPNGEDQSPWYWSFGSGRFDLQTPHGTLNAAEEKTGAVLESFSTQLVGRSWVRREEVEKRNLIALPLPYGVDLADLRSSSALKAGVVPGELTGAYGDYVQTQSLAAAVFNAGRGGIAAPLRFGSAFRQDGFYLFGLAGVQAHPIGDELELEEAIEEIGYAIVDAPRSDAITLLE